MQSLMLEIVLTLILMYVILSVSTGAKERGIMAERPLGPSWHSKRYSPDRSEREKGYDLSRHGSKSLDEIPDGELMVRDDDVNRCAQPEMARSALITIDTQRDTLDRPPSRRLIR